MAVQTLGVLLVRPNQVVSVGALVAGLWGEQLPPTAAKTLQSHVKRLRRALEPGRVRFAAGEVLDAARFEELAAQGRPGYRGGRHRGVAAAPGAGAMAG